MKNVPRMKQNFYELKASSFVFVTYKQTHSAYRKNFSSCLRIPFLFSFIFCVMLECDACAFLRSHKTTIVSRIF